jgi:hypothetical protein
MVEFVALDGVGRRLMSYLLLSNNYRRIFLYDEIATHHTPRLPIKSGTAAATVGDRQVGIISWPAAHQGNTVEDW